jgi:hypothetical protein
MRQVHGVDWRDPAGYTLCLNTALLGYERVADLVLAAAGYPDQPPLPRTADARARPRP